MKKYVRETSTQLKLYKVREFIFMAFIELGGGGGGQGGGLHIIRRYRLVHFFKCSLYDWLIKDPPADIRQLKLNQSELNYQTK